MRVLHVITGLRDGGAEAVLYRLARAERSHVAGVLSLTTGGVYKARFQQLGIQVLEIDFRHPESFIRNVQNAFHFAKHTHPDVVQTWMYHADVIGSALAIAVGAPKIVWGVHSATFDSLHVSATTRLLARVCAGLSHFVPDAIICASQCTREIHARHGYARHALQVVYNGVDFDEFQPSYEIRMRARRDLGAQDSDFIVGMVARWDPVKNHKALLSALASAPEANGGPSMVVFVGEGMTFQNQELQAAIRRSGCTQRVLCLGSRSDIPALMNAFDVLALPSHSEAMGNVLVEAMACGTPCIATDVGASVDIIGQEGWVVPVDNVTAIRSALLSAKEMLERKEYWMSFCHRVRKNVLSRYSVEAMLRGYEKVWSTP